MKHLSAKATAEFHGVPYQHALSYFMHRPLDPEVGCEYERHEILKRSKAMGLCPRCILAFDDWYAASYKIILAALKTGQGTAHYARISLPECAVRE
jgi:hypothetical protein